MRSWGRSPHGGLATLEEEKKEKKKEDERRKRERGRERRRETRLQAVCTHQESPCDDTARRLPSTSQEERPHQELHLWAP